MRALAEAGLLAVVALGVLLDARAYPGSLAEGAPGPAFFPRLLATLLVACAAWLALRAKPWRRSRGNVFSAESGPRRSRGNVFGVVEGGGVLRLGLAVGWIAAFLLAWPRLGTVVSVPLLVGGLMWLTGERSRVVLGVVPLVFAGFIYLVFMVALGVPLPSGF